MILAGKNVSFFDFCLLKLVTELKVFKKFSKEINLQVKILAFGFTLFWFFMDQFYNGNMSTENITVDVSDLLYSEQQLINTKRERQVLTSDLNWQTGN